MVTRTRNSKPETTHARLRQREYCHAERSEASSPQANAAVAEGSKACAKHMILRCAQDDRVAASFPEGFSIGELRPEDRAGNVTHAALALHRVAGAVEVIGDHDSAAVELDRAGVAQIPRAPV